MKIQLRMYTINRGALEQFATEWKEQVQPLRLSLGFQVLGAWTVPATNQFVWLLGYDGPDAWDTVDQTYYQSEERRTMQPDPSRLIARIEHHFIEAVP